MTKRQKLYTPARDGQEAWCTPHSGVLMSRGDPARQGGVWQRPSPMGRVERRGRSPPAMGRRRGAPGIAGC